MAEDDEIELEDNEQSDDEAFVTYDIAAYPADYTLSVIDEMWRNGDIVVPPFQRKFVWSIKQSSLLIESLLMGLPVPQAFFFADPQNRYLVIDGLQRIMSIIYFFKGFFGEENYQGKKLVFRLTGLSEKSPYAGKTFEGLDAADQRKLKGRVLRVINIKQIGPTNDDTSAYHIFERLNTGGTPLKAQEIRNCVFNGPLVDALTRLNADKNWRRILGKSVFDKHQKDIEMVLRILAVSTRISEYEKPMKEFLNKTMSHYQDASAVEIQTFIEKFSSVCEEVAAKLGDAPFHIKSGRLNVSALDSVMGILCGASVSIPRDLSARFQELKNDPEFLNTLSVSTSDASVVKRRIETARQHLLGA